MNNQKSIDDSPFFVYTKKGVKKHIRECEEDEIVVQEICLPDAWKRYSLYVDLGDSIVQEKVIGIHDIVINHIFEDRSFYFIHSKVIPIFVSQMGMSSDEPANKEDFKKILQECRDIPNINRYLYLEDIRLIVSAIQNLLIGMQNDVIDFYKIIAETDCLGISDFNRDCVWKISGSEANILINILGGYFTKAHSILDLMTKIAFELQTDQYDFSTYMKLKCSKILYGDKGKLKDLNDLEGTVFRRDEIINTVESIRNEVIHNGTWEPIPKMFIEVKGGQIIERFILFPDLVNGRYDKYVNRYHFFGKGIKVNDELPILHRAFLERIQTTIEKMEEIYS